MLNIILFLCCMLLGLSREATEERMANSTAHQNPYLALSSLNTTFHKSRHMKQTRNSAVTSSKYCFGLEAFPYRTNFQTCCILCLKNILKVFVFHFKTSWTPFFPWLHFATIYLYESNLHWNLNINNTTYYWKILSCFNIWLRITKIIEA